MCVQVCVYIFYTVGSDLFFTKHCITSFDVIKNSSNCGFKCHSTPSYKCTVIYLFTYIENLHSIFLIFNSI